MMAPKPERPEDARGGPGDDPFTYRATKGGRVLISRGGQVVVTLGGDAAGRLLDALAEADDPQHQQLLLAKSTGNYRRGNEHPSRPRG